MPRVNTCKHPGCFSERGDGGYCAKHQRYRVADAPKPRRPGDGSYHGAARPNEEIYQGYKWRKLSREIIKERGHCEYPGCNSTYRLGCHHLIPIKYAPDLVYEKDNIIVLCVNCHAKVTSAENRR